MAIALSVAYTATPLAANTKMAIYATGQLSQGIVRPSSSAYKLLAITAAAAASPANVLAAYNAKYGALLAGRKIFFRAILIKSNGIPSGPLDASVVVT